MLNLTRPKVANFLIICRSNGEQSNVAIFDELNTTVRKLKLNKAPTGLLREVRTELTKEIHKLISKIKYWRKINYLVSNLPKRLLSDM